MELLTFGFACWAADASHPGALTATGFTYVMQTLGLQSARGRIRIIQNSSETPRGRTSLRGLVSPFDALAAACTEAFDALAAGPCTGAS
jgi:hypothetical protein